jgi:hypothetical protein
MIFSDGVSFNDLAFFSQLVTASYKSSIFHSRSTTPAAICWSQPIPTAFTVLTYSSAVIEVGGVKRNCGPQIDETGHAATIGFDHVW